MKKKYPIIFYIKKYKKCLIWLSLLIFSFLAILYYSSNIPHGYLKVECYSGGKKILSKLIDKQDIDYLFPRYGYYSSKNEKTNTRSFSVGSEDNPFLFVMNADCVFKGSGL